MRALSILVALVVGLSAATPLGPASAGELSAAAAGIVPSAGAPGAATSQRFDPPLPLDVLTPFRPPASRYGSGHRGVDLAGSPGDPVRASGSGTVVFAGPLAGRGVVSIEHAAGLRTTYEPVTARVSAGDVVQRGEVIGMLEAGHESCAPGACLHFGVRLPDRIYLDPLSLFRVWEVRLKPWAGIPPE